MDNSLLEAAISYAKIGWHVFPCAPGKKTPITAHGVKDATKNVDQIKEWWEKYPNANIAVACGIASGICVVDIDKNDKSNGWEEVEKLSKAGLVLQKTVTQLTPSGGAHFVYQYDHNVKNENSKRFPGIDIRSNGYYIIIAPSIHPNGKPYEWDNGLDPFHFSAAQFPEFLKVEVTQETVPPWRRHEIQHRKQEVVDTTNKTIESTRDTLRRASAYLALCDVAVQGQGGHNKLLWAAVALVHGFRLSDAQAFELLRTEYNPRCVPPWDLSNQQEYKDFVRKITEARKLTPEKQPGWLLVDDTYLTSSSTITDDDIEELISNSGVRGVVVRPDGIADAQCETDDSELDFLLHPIGLLGRVCSHINKTSIKPQPLLTLGCVISFLGALFGRKVKDSWDSRTNLYCMGIADSGTGKNHAPKQIRRLMLESACTDLLGGDDFASDAGIETRLQQYPSSIFLCDEIGYLFRSIKKYGSAHTSKIISTLLKLYSSSGDIYKGRVYADSDKQRVIIQPCCCVWGTSTPEVFLEGLSVEEIQNGWLSRCLVFQSHTDPPKNRKLHKLNFPKDIVEDIHKWHTRSIEQVKREGDIDTYLNAVAGNMVSRPPSQLLVPTCEAANKIFEHFENECQARSEEDPYTTVLWKRCEENARKISLIVAAGNSFNNPEIDGGIADYSCRLVKYLLENFIKHISNNISSSPVEHKKIKIISIISSHGDKGCSKWRLTQMTRDLSRRERDDILDDLIYGRDLLSAIANKGTKNSTLTFWTPKFFPRKLLQEDGNE